MIRRLVEHQFRHRWAWMAGFAVALAPCVWAVSSLRVRSDFKELLPQNKPSVVTLDRIIAEVGGIDSLIVAVEGEDHVAMERFIEALVAKLGEFPQGYIRYVDYNVGGAEKFFADRKYLYLDLADLVSIRERIAAKIASEKLRNNPLFFSLEDEAEKKDELDFSDLKAKYGREAGRFEGYTDGYYFGEQNRLAAVVIRPFGASTGIDFTQDLMARVQRAVDEVGPASYHRSLKIRYSGKYQETIQEYQQVIRDMLETLGLCLLLVAAAIYLYFWRARVLVFLSIPLAAGALVTFALTRWTIGYLNSQTAFLGSVIVGNGINTGVIFLARYLEERRRGVAPLPAMATTLRTTWLGTMCAAVTTSAGFACLLASEIKGFSHFGFIGGIGMMATWFAYFVALPPVVFVLESRFPMVRESGRVPLNQWQGLFDALADLIARRARAIAVVGIAGAVASAALFARAAPDALEYDFSKLRNRYRETGETEAALKARITAIFGENTSPSTILIDHPAQAAEVCAKVMAAEADVAAADRTIDKCRSILDFVPADQPAKLAELRRIRALLRDGAVNFAQGEHRREIDALRATAALRPFGMDELPVEVKRNFMKADGTLGRFVYVYPTPDAKLSNGRRLIQFADRLASIRLADGSEFRTSGQSAIFADLLKSVKKDGPFATVFSLLTVCAIAALTFRTARASGYVIAGLVLGAIYMLGLQALLGIKLNFFNFIAIPVTYGIGIDYGVNLYQRYLYEKDILAALRGTGSAIFLCSITTFISYVTLLTAQNQALVSFGWLALLGEGGCLFASLVVMPALTILGAGRRRRAQAESPKAAAVS